MKKICLAAALVFFFGCSSNEKKTTEDKSKNEVGVQDNGGVPDTTNAINLSTHKKDTVQSKDSSKK